MDLLSIVSHGSTIQTGLIAGKQDADQSFICVNGKRLLTTWFTWPVGHKTIKDTQTQASQVPLMMHRGVRYYCATKSNSNKQVKDVSDIVISARVGKPGDV